VVSANQLTDPRLLSERLGERQREAGMPPLTRAERKENAETALRWLAVMASGQLRGFDIRPAGDAVLGVLAGPPLVDEAMVNAVQVAGALPGARAQKELIAVLLDGKRPVPVRIVAAAELQRNIQKFGPPEPRQEQALKAGLQAALRDRALPGPLRDWMGRLEGTLRPDGGATGRRLRDFVP
jgi:hypothetical protein